MGTLPTFMSYECKLSFHIPHSDTKTSTGLSGKASIRGLASCGTSILWSTVEQQHGTDCWDT